MKRHTFHRMLIPLIIVGLLLGGVNPVQSTSVYTKATEWAIPELETAGQQGLIPQRLLGQDMTRPATREEVCELAVVLYERLTGTVAEPKSPNPFTDTVNPSVLKALQLGVTSGTAPTLFSPNKTITREEVATLYGRTIAKAFPGEDRSVSGTPVFTDQALISSWALEHVLYMNRIGVLKGSNNKFMPRPITPEEIASGIGTTSREAAIAISLRTKIKFDGTVAQPTASPTPMPSVIPGINHLSLVNQLSFNVMTDNGMPAVKLKDNRIYPLLPLEERPLMTEIMPANLHPTPLEVSKFVLAPPPATVDHRSVQTSIKDQAGRNTCVSFALIAGMEAAYVRKDPVKYKDLDLSEQYANYLQKMARLVDPPIASASLRENSLGRWGWGNVMYSTSLFNRLYGVPQETFLPYITGGAYENTNQTTDNPRIDPDNTSVTQRQINDVNLTAPDYSRQAIEQARYGIKSFSYIPSGQLTDPRSYENVLAAGYDIVFGMEITGPDPTPDNNIWNAGTNKHGGHAMLMVGYDDARQVFILKNSWGYDNVFESGFTLLSYDNIKKGNVYEATYITDIVTDLDNGYRKEQLFLGRWKLNQDGWRGTLDINRLPDYYQTDLLMPASFGTDDNRIGTFFDLNGVAHRVNGSIQGNKIVFRIDVSKPNQDYDDLSGKPFTGYLFGRNPDTIAGTMMDGSTYYGFYATQGEWLAPDASPGGDFAGTQYIGNWAMNHDGWPGTLSITAVHPLTGVLTATYKNAQNQSFPVTGKVQTGARAITFSIAFDASSPQVFNGYLYSWDRGVMGGLTYWAGIPFGWVAERHNLVMQIPIMPIRIP